MWVQSGKPDIPQWISMRDGGDTIRPSTQLSTASPKTASEQSNTKSEKTPRKVSELTRRVSGCQSDAEVMRVTTQRFDDSAIRSHPTREALRGLVVIPKDQRLSFPILSETSLAFRPIFCADVLVCDGIALVFVNRRQIGGNNGWSRPFTREPWLVSLDLKPGSQDI